MKTSMAKMTVQVAKTEEKVTSLLIRKLLPKAEQSDYVRIFSSVIPSLQSPQFDDFCSRQNRLNHVETRLNIDQFSFSYGEKIKVTDICYL